VSAVKLLTAGYFVGAAIFAYALVIILLRAFDLTELNPSIPLIGGFVIMFGSKFALAAALRKAR
jgi:hypothetical protein